MSVALKLLLRLLRIEVKTCPFGVKDQSEDAPYGVVKDQSEDFVFLLRLPSKIG
jgi:hypothetical protein